ncbi:MAG: hypothetical protein H6739_20645 [Alphaproteobacteria bacterium]|nr:hypothetical protein [Alphaproteobacteria bacterium]
MTERRVRALIDGVALVALLALGWTTMPAAHTGAVEGLPAWATLHDAVLDGPDAGEWAANATHLHRGDVGALDVHRMPTWLMLVAAALFGWPDVALAGHGVNHALMLALPLVVYGLGRAGGGPFTGFAAGVTVLFCAPLVVASRRYGVDAAVAFMLPLALLAAVPVRRWWGLAPVAGAVAGLAALTHFTALPYALPPALLILLRGPKGWRRPAAVLLHLGAAAATVWLLSRVLPLPSPAELVTSISEGVAKGEQAEAGALSEAARTTLLTGAAQAVPEALQAGLSPFWAWWMPWTLVLAAPWVGVVGLGLGGCKKPDGAGLTDKLRALMSWPDLGLGLALLACLAPLPVLAAAGAEPRYAANLLPFAAVLVVRGLVSPFAFAEGLVRLRWSRWPRGLLALIPAWTLTWTAWHVGAPLREVPLPPLGQAVAARELGAAIAARFPGPGGAASPVREAAAHAGRDYCPQTPCPFGATEADFLACVDILRAQCPGEGDIPYVVLIEGPVGVGPHEQAMGAWARARYETVATVQRGGFLAHLVAVPR